MPMIESRTSHTTKNTTKIRSQQASEARFLSLPHKAPYLSTSAHKICSPAAHRPCRPCPDPVSYRRSSPGELGKRNEDRGWVDLVFLFCEEKGRTSTSTCFLTMWTMWWSEYFSMQKKKTWFPTGPRKFDPYPCLLPKQKQQKTHLSRKSFPR